MRGVVLSYPKKNMRGKRMTEELCFFFLNGGEWGQGNPKNMVSAREKAPHKHWACRTGCNNQAGVVRMAAICGGM